MIIFSDIYKANTSAKGCSPDGLTNIMLCFPKPPTSSRCFPRGGHYYYLFAMIVCVRQENVIDKSIMRVEIVQKPVCNLMNPEFSYTATLPLTIPHSCLEEFLLPQNICARPGKHVVNPIANSTRFCVPVQFNAASASTLSQ